MGDILVWVMKLWDFTPSHPNPLHPTPLHSTPWWGVVGSDGVGCGGARSDGVGWRRAREPTHPHVEYVGLAQYVEYVGWPYMYTSNYMCVVRYTYTYMCIHIHIYIHIYICMHTYIYTHIYIYIYIYIHMYI